MPDTAYLQGNINKASSSQRPWKIPAGVYHYSSPLILPPNTQIEGDGPTFGTVFAPYYGEENWWSNVKEKNRGEFANKGG